MKPKRQFGVMAMDNNELNYRCNGFSPLHHRPCGGDPESRVLSEIFWMAGTSPAMESLEKFEWSEFCSASYFLMDRFESTVKVQHL